MPDPVRDRNIQSEFHERRMKQLLASGFAILALVGLFVTERRAGGDAFRGSMVGIIVGVGVFSLINWRCPGCKAYLGKSFSPRYCPRCGVGLQ